MPIYNYKCRECGEVIEKITFKIPSNGPEPTITIGLDDVGCKCSSGLTRKNSSNETQECIFDLIPSAHSVSASWSKWRIM